MSYQRNIPGTLALAKNYEILTEKELDAKEDDCPFSRYFEEDYMELFGNQEAAYCRILFSQNYTTMWLLHPIVSTFYSFSLETKITKANKMEGARMESQVFDHQ